MKRRSFLALPLAVQARTAMLVPTLSAAVSPQARPPRDSGLLITSGADRDGQPFQWLDATFHVKVSGKDTGGRCVIFDTFRPAKVGPPCISTLIVTNGFL